MFCVLENLRTFVVVKSNVRIRLGVQGWTSGVSITLVLVLVGLIVLSYFSAQNLSRYVRENIGFTVYADPDSKDGDIKQLEQYLRRQPYVKETVYVSSEEALKEQTKELGADPAEFLGYNPYTPMIEVLLRAEYANTDSIKLIEQQLKQRVQIAEVDYQQTLIDAMNKNMRTAGIILSVLALLFALISFALINNTMRMAVYSRRFEINTMQLVGATRGFIRRPFVARCMFVGLLSGCIACVVLYGGYFWLAAHAPELKAIIDLSAVMWSAGVVLAGGVLLTSLAALLSMNYYLKMRINKLFH